MPYREVWVARSLLAGEEPVSEPELTVQSHERERPEPTPASAHPCQGRWGRMGAVGTGALRGAATRRPGEASFQTKGGGRLGFILSTKGFELGVLNGSGDHGHVVCPLPSPLLSLSLPRHCHHRHHAITVITVTITVTPLSLSLLPSPSPSHHCHSYHHHHVTVTITSPSPPCHCHHHLHHRHGAIFLSPSGWDSNATFSGALLVQPAE